MKAEPQREEPAARKGSRAKPESGAAVGSSDGLGHVMLASTLSTLSTYPNKTDKTADHSAEQRADWQSAENSHKRSQIGLRPDKRRNN
jgi:hypothetical protein